MHMDMCMHIRMSHHTPIAYVVISTDVVVTRRVVLFHVLYLVLVELERHVTHPFQQLLMSPERPNMPHATQALLHPHDMVHGSQ